MTVRPARSEDFEEIAEITRREVLENYAHFETNPPSADELREDWIATRERYPVFVAVEEGAVLGFSKAYPWKQRGAYRATCEVGVYVRPEHQGKGVASALYEQLLPELARRGFHTLIAGIAQPNDPSVRLHERFGMEYAGTLPEVG